jgi:hypothetical protein
MGIYVLTPNPSSQPRHLPPLTVRPGGSGNIWETLLLVGVIMLVAIGSEADSTCHTAMRNIALFEYPREAKVAMKINDV